MVRGPLPVWLAPLRLAGPAQDRCPPSPKSHTRAGLQPRNRNDEPAHSQSGATICGRWLPGDSRPRLDRPGTDLGVAGAHASETALPAELIDVVLPAGLAAAQVAAGLTQYCMHPDPCTLNP